MWRLIYKILYFLKRFLNGLSGPLVLKTKKLIFDQKIIFLRILTKFGQYALKIIFWPTFFEFKTYGPESPLKKLSKKHNIIY